MKHDKETLMKLMESVNPDFRFKINEEGMAQVPTELDNVDNDILRAGIMSEMDAINLYEQLAAKTENENIKKVLLDIAKEEKTHIGEFQSLLTKIDPEYSEELINGNEEVGEIIESLNSEESCGVDFERFFRELLNSYGYEPSQIDEMPEEERRQFFDDLDKKWTSNKEEKYLDEE
jgi:rubrerythrin